MHRAVFDGDVVGDVRRGGDQHEVELPLEPFAHDLQVQQAQESAAEAEAQGHRGLRLIVQRGVVQLELVQRITQHGVVRAVHRIQPGEDHGLGFLVAAERLGGRNLVGGDGVADLGLAHILHAGDQVAHLPDAEALGRHRLG